MSRINMNACRWVAGALFPCLAAIPLGGCGLLDALFGPSLTTVVLRNDGDFVVDVVLYVGDQQEVPEDVLKATGDKLEFSIPPGDFATFARDCDDLQAIVIDQAELNIIGEIGPKTDTGVLRDGTDFHCGSTINFTFDHGPTFTDFAVTTTVTDPDAERPPDDGSS